MSKLDTRVIQVTNVAPTTTKEQLKTLFQFIGRIRDCKLFPPEGSDQQVAAKVCYVEFEDSTAAGVALHLTNTVFIDRALIVVPVMDGKIPDEKVAMQLTPQTVARMAPGQPSWPTNVVSQLTGTGIDQVITTYDPRLNALGLPQYPPLPPTLDAAKVEEVRRTVYVGNLDPKTTPESLISFFSQAGEVKYVRMAGEDTSIARAAYLELTDQRSVANYLGYNGILYNGRPITVSHAKSSINKPLTKSQEASRREVEEAMKKVQEAQALISAAAAEKFVTRSRSRSRRRSRSRSRSRSKRRSRSRSRGRRRRSRSRSRRKSRSPRRVRRSRSRSPRRRRSRSRSGFVVIPARELGPRLPRRRRSRSTSRPRRRSRSRSKRRSRTPPRAYSGRHSRSRSKGPRRKSRSRTPRRSRSRSRGKGKDKKEKVKESEKKKKEKKASRSRSLSPPTLQREGSGVRHSGDDRSPGRLDPSAKEDTGKQSQTETVSQAALPQGAKKTRSEAASEKKSSQKRDRSESPTAGRRAKSVSRSPVRGSRKRSASRSPVKSSRRRSVSPRKRRSKSRSPRRSRSPVKKKKARSPRRSRSGSRHRSKKDKKKERSRSKERKEKKKKNKDKKEEKEKEKGTASSSSKAVTRNYDEEEKGFNSASDREEEMRSQKDEYEDDRRSGGADRQLVDMDTSD